MRHIRAKAMPTILHLSTYPVCIPHFRTRPPVRSPLLRASPRLHRLEELCLRMPCNSPAPAEFQIRPNRVSGHVPDAGPRDRHKPTRLRSIRSVNRKNCNRIFGRGNSYY